MYEIYFGGHLMIVEKIMFRDCIFFSEYLLHENYTFFVIDAKTLKGHAVKELYLHISPRGRILFYS